MRPWWVPRSWEQDTDRAGAGDWARYALCRIIGHRITNDHLTHWCTRCGDTMPDGARRFQK